MRKIKQILAMVMCLCMLMAVAPDPAIADTWDNRGSAFVNLQGGGAVDETLFQEWAEASGGRFTAEALKEFALNLQNEYVPRILSGITETFSFAQKPSAKGMKIRLKLYSNSYKKAELASVTSNGTGYLLSVNMAALTATDDKKVDPDGDYGSFYGSLAHEMMHAVMFDVTSAGMLADRDWYGNGYIEHVDEFPDWFYEGIAQTIGGGVEWCGKLKDDLYAIQPEWKDRDKEAETKDWLGKFYWIGNESYAQGYIACLYLGHVAGGETGSITSKNIVKGLNDIVLDVEDGYSLSQAIYRQTEGKYTSIEDFQKKFPDDAYHFSMEFLDTIDAGSSDVNWHATGSLLAREGLGVSKLVMYKGLTGKSDYFTLDISRGDMYDNSAVLKDRVSRTGGGATKTKGLRRDGTVNTDARMLWTPESYKESDVTDEEVKPQPSPNPGGGATGGGGVPAAPTEMPKTEPTQSGSTTITDISGSTVSKDGQTASILDKRSADKLVETAYANKSEEIVINAVTGKQSAGSDVNASEVALPAESLKTIAEKTNADVVIKTDVAEVRFDNKAVEAVASQAQQQSLETETISIAVRKIKEGTGKARYELKVVTSGGQGISDFKEGNVTVTVNIPKALLNKRPVCVYIDNKDHMHRVGGKLNTNGTFTFTMGNFSYYAIMAEEEAEKAIEEQKEAVKKIKMKLRSQLVETRSGKKAIRLIWTNPSSLELDGIKIYRSLKKNSGYGKKPIFISKNGSYTNSAVKKGTRCYYKVRGFVTIDGQTVYTPYSGKANRTVR